MSVVVSLGSIRETIKVLKDHQQRAPTRATALAITKLEEAEMWLERTNSTETGAEPGK